jgi:hypothetical protein
VLSLSDLLDLSLERSDSGILLTGPLTQDALFAALDRLRVLGCVLVSVARRRL